MVVDGEKYTGYTLPKNSRFHGPGCLIYPNGACFEGMWEKGIRKGFGKFVGKEGIYEGMWDKDKWHGKGQFAFPDGRVF